MPEQIRVIVTFDLKSMTGDKDKFYESLVATAEQSRAEAGCLFYETLRSSSRPDTVVISELWDDAANYDEHHDRRIAYFGAHPEELLSPETFPGLRIAFEFYRHKEYALVDGTFVASDPSSRLNAIHW